ncbi:MAG: DUF3108 domain-containing protein [Candidatus Amulumruptor caecigallinarius]|nr:DUF3108 domain-containing protein [Candidatus Amulumruptor caecigallinarius]MCM1396806.1 DUF3108 domain-containing protein [Candidatus Amulumruptor caecigallinarius]MCM1454250.1 DUF3108 domain-containing protein [bacterium]
MKRTIRIAAATLLCLMVSLQASATGFTDEVLKYKVMFKWGIISKVAGHATLDLRTSPTEYRATLTARSASWADRIYSLRDTMYTTMDPSTMLPELYVYIAHENGKYVKDTVKFTRTGDEFTGIATRRKRNKDGQWSEGETTLKATGPSVDLLSLFFYVRQLDFPRMSTGTTVVMNCFSGKKTEVLTLTYKGTQKVTVNGKEQLAYYVGFTFTKNGKKSSAPIYAWLSTNAARTPLQVVGTLPVGKIKVELME